MTKKKSASNKSSDKPKAAEQGNQKKPGQGALERVEVVIKKKVLGEAPVEHHFVVADGKRLKNIIELADALETMTEEVFMHHANEFRNDFSNWIGGVFKDHSLAEEMKKAKNRLESQIVILRRLVKELM